MKKFVAALAVVLTSASMPAQAEPEFSVNLGMMSDYIYRGIHQSDAVANGGLDLTAGPFYLGTWLADLDSGSGVEIDVYGGLSHEFDNGISVYVGYTAYRYTEDDAGTLTALEGTYNKVSEGDVIPTKGKVYKYVGSGESSPTANLNSDGSGTYVFADSDTFTKTDYELLEECVGGGFDSDYDEINMGVAYAKDDFSVSLDYSIGEHENEHACSSTDNDYDIATLTLDYKGAYVTFGTYGLSEDDEDKGEPEGDYFEIGYATTISDFDVAVYLVDSDKDLDDESRMVFTVGYAFGL